MNYINTNEMQDIKMRNLRTKPLEKIKVIVK